MNRMAYVLSERERRMQEGKLQRRINGARNLIYNTTRDTVVQKLPNNQAAALHYLRFLCGLEPDAGDLDPREKSRVGNLFATALKKHCNQLKNLPKDIMPGMAAVNANRKVVAKLQSDAGKANRKRGQSGENMVHSGESHAWKIIREQNITW